MALVELLASIPMSTEDIWEGDAELFPVLFQFRESFQRLSPDATGPSTYNVLTFNLPLTHFPVGKKRFRVNRNLPTSSLVSLLCSKMGIPNPERFSLYSLKGYKLNPNEPLVSYGFGPLFKTWELNVRKNPELEEDGNSEESLAKMMIETPVVLHTDGEPVVVTFPPLVELAGLQRKTFRMSKEELSMSINDLIKRLWSKLSLTNPDKFTFMAFDESVSVQIPKDKKGVPQQQQQQQQQSQQQQQQNQQQKWFVLNPEKSLADYGLGWRFHGWELKVVFIDLAIESETVKCPLSSYGWASIQRSLPTAKEALLISTIFDKRLISLQQQNQQLLQQSQLDPSIEQQNQSLIFLQQRQQQMEQEQQQKLTESENTVNTYKQKLTDMEKLLGEMETKLISVESELKDAGDTKNELSAMTERYNQLEARYNDLFNRATTIPTGIQSRCTLAEERLVGCQAECEKYKRMYMAQKLQNDALVAYALKSGFGTKTCVSASDSEDLEKKSALDHNAVLIQENNNLKESNLSLTKENVKLNERIRELQSKLDVILESFCKNPASLASSTSPIIPSTLMSASAVPAGAGGAAGGSDGGRVSSGGPSSIKTVKRGSSPSLSSSSLSSSSEVQAPPQPGTSSPKDSDMATKSVAGELHSIRENIRVARGMSFSIRTSLSSSSPMAPSGSTVLPSQKLQRVTSSSSTLAVAPPTSAQIAARHQSIPLTMTEKQQLLKKINEQKETMIRTNRGSYDPRSIASQASKIYAGLSTKFSEDQYGSTEDLKGEL